MKKSNSPASIRKEQLQRSIFRMKEDVINNIETNLEDLIRETGMPQRTFYYNFKQMTDESPKRFIKNLKLKKVQEELIAAKRGMQTIQEIAGGYGFHHMGQFSQDYKNVIGELPSETFKKRIKDPFATK
ncbi:helix-turn-helix domain-containing protein [Aquiflexum sp. TKW24L]|uniref:helix-turn-helix domain-containing protein n=1 Tax=Aquiflexum sp. TKW24L TaxID=2942212 RepID=UPI0020BD88EA|nr:helix-turn-helix domain-containing protein [Aquiflexum sp. TKW24L]MCL6259821.1 helix-turn-helix domain-containing protein [Aquiflexum sp. TKW24L]